MVCTVPSTLNRHGAKASGSVAGPEPGYPQAAVAVAPTVTGPAFNAVANIFDRKLDVPFRVDVVTVT